MSDINQAFGGDVPLGHRPHNGIAPPFRGDNKKGLNSYLLGIAEALLLGYSMGSGKHFGLRPDRWRGELKAAYKVLLAGGNAATELSEAFRYPLGQEPIETLATLVKEQHNEWTQAEARKRLLTLSSRANPELLAKAIRLLESESNEGNKKQLPVGLVSGRGQASSLPQSNGGAVQSTQAMANLPRTSQAPGNHAVGSREQPRTTHQTQVVGGGQPRTGKAP